jgi:hypothetical protein
MMLSACGSPSSKSDESEAQQIATDIATCRGAGSVSTQKLCDYYNAHHSRIVAEAKAELDSWGVAPENMGGYCAITLSFALDKSGAASQREYNSSTSNLSQSLRNQGWRKVSCEKLLPGDVVFTVDPQGGTAGAPYHSFMFMGYVPQTANAMGWGLDYHLSAYRRYVNKPGIARPSGARRDENPLGTHSGNHLCQYGLRGPS